MFNDAVLAGCVHGLEDEQHPPSAVSIEFPLQVREPLDTLGQPLLGLFFGLQACRVARVEILQPEFLAACHPERLDVALNSFHDVCHSVNLLSRYASPKCWT